MIARTLGRLIKSEARKVLYARTFYGLLLGATAFVSLSCATSPYVIAKETSSGLLKTPGLENAQIVEAIYGKALAGYVFVLIMAIISMAGEYKNHTAVATFLVAPKRWMVMAAKMVVAASTGVIYMLVSAGVGFGAIAIALSFYDNVATPDPMVYANALISAVVLGVVLGVLGVAVGTLVRSQTLAVTGAILWMLLVEPLLLLFVSGANKFLITGLLTSMMNIKLNVKSNVGVAVSTTDYLDPLPATLLMLA